MAALVTYSPPSDKIVHETNADFVTRDGYGNTVYVTQGDVDLPVIAVHMYKNSQPYAVPTSAEGNIRWKKPNPDRHFVYNPLLGVNADRTIAYIEVTSQMVTTPGHPEATLEIVLSNEVINSEHLAIIIDRNPIKQVDLESTNEVKALTEYVETAEDAASRAKTSATESATSAGRADSAAQRAANSAANASVSASESSSSASEAKQSATKASESAVSAADSADTAKQYSTHPNRVGNNGNWWAWDPELQVFVDTGDRAVLNYDVTYTSVAEMNEDADNQKPGTVAIISTDVNIEDNAKTYVKRSDGTWGFIADLSGFPGVGVKDVTLRSGDHSPGTTDLYVMELTDERQIQIPIYNGANGGVLTVNGQDGEVTLSASDVDAYTTEETDVKVTGATSIVYPVNVMASGWTAVSNDPVPTWQGKTAKWMNTVEVPGMTETANIPQGCITFTGGSYAAAGEWTWLQQGVASIIFYSAKDKAPTEDFTLSLTEVR